MTGVERSNRKQTIISRLKRYIEENGKDNEKKSDYIRIGLLQDWFGLSNTSTRARLQGVPHLSGGKYLISDVAAKVVQMEDENA